MKTRLMIYREVIKSSHNHPVVLPQYFLHIFLSSMCTFKVAWTMRNFLISRPNKHTWEGKSRNLNGILSKISRCGWDWMNEKWMDLRLFIWYSIQSSRVILPILMKSLDSVIWFVESLPREYKIRWILSKIVSILRENICNVVATMVHSN